MENRDGDGEHGQLRPVTTHSQADPGQRSERQRHRAGTERRGELRGVRDPIGPQVRDHVELATPQRLAH